MQQQKKLFRRYIIILLAIFQFSNSHGIDISDLLAHLDAEIDKKETYQQEKIQRIDNLIGRLEAVREMGEKMLEYELSRELYLEYQSYTYDSAYKYVVEMIRLANEMEEKPVINQAKVQMGFTFLSSGLFKESLDTLQTIRSSDLDSLTRIDYYLVLARTYYDLALYHNTGRYLRHYNRIGNLVLDSALRMMPESSERYWLTMGQRRLKAGDFQGAADAYNFVLSQFEIDEREYAIATSSLGYVYSMLGRADDAFTMLINAAIADIKSSTKETVAFRNIAIQLYDRGMLDQAYRYIILALENATFYNARHRKVEIGEVLPIIEGKRISILESQRRQLLWYGITTTFLILVVTLFVVAFYRQLRKSRSIRKILQETNLNLTEMNEALRESNKIKEEYIGYFFNINSEYISRLEGYQKTIKRKIAARQYEDLNDMIRSSELHREREKLFSNFDEIFVKLFPNFLEEFNKLFREEDRIVLEQDELLNPDLRIFALMRLGVTDSEKIANFLNYSVNTIYTYKTKLKQKSIVPKEEFDERVLAIRSVRFI